MLKRTSIRFKLPAAMVLTTLVTSAAYTAVLLQTREAAVILVADQKLLMGAYEAKGILGTAYHDRIVDRSSISPQEYRKIAVAYDRLCQESGLQYAWSLMIYNGKTVFTSATHTVLSDPTSAFGEFLEPHTNPQAYEHAFATMSPEYATFHDKWGQGRMVLLPEYDSHGRKHLHAASIRLDDLGRMMRRTVLESVAIGSSIAVVAALMAGLLARSLAKPIVRLTEASERVANGDLDAPLSADGSHELVVLSASLDAMRRSIRSQMETLKQEIEVRRKTEEELRHRTSELARAEAVISHSPVIAFRWRASPGAPVEFVTENVVQFGFTAQDILAGKVRFADFVHPDDSAKVMDRLAEYQRTGINEFTQEYRILTASGEVRWVEERTKVATDSADGIARYEGVVIDITARRLAEERLRESEQHFAAVAERNRRLVLEVEHRVGNNIAGMLGLISAMKARATHVDRFAVAIESRLMAMAHTHKLLSEAHWEEVDLQKLIRSTLDTMRWVSRYANPVELEGPDVSLLPAQAMPLTLILVEWLNNSCKYGAHSSPEGRLAIRWSIGTNGESGLVRLTWTESGGPRVVGSITPSLGTELVTAFARNELRGTCSMRYAPEGAAHTIEFPVAS